MIMIKSVFLFPLVLFISFFSFSQNGWNWPEDSNLKNKALEQQAYYKILMAQNKYDEAMGSLNWLYQNNPNLNPSIYIEGVECLEKIIRKETDEVRKNQLKDSILWIFDRRLALFDNDANTINYKVSKAFQFFYKDVSRYPDLLRFFELAYEMNGPDILTRNLNTYMFLAKNYHQANPTEMPADKVLDIHSQVSEIIEIKKKNSKNKSELDKLDKEQSKTDTWLSSISNILNCDFIKEKLVPKFRADPTNLKNAKKIFRYALEAKCTDNVYWLDASEIMFKSQPSYRLAFLLGNRYNKDNQLVKGLQYHKKAEKLATSDDEKYDAVIGQILATIELGNKPSARKLAYQALDLKKGSKEVYNIIGNLYFTSYDECRGNESVVQDRAIFLAAYSMYALAENTAQMTASKAQFPSIEEIFNEGMEERQSITVGCWINELVILKRR